jgi:3-hydroxybutyryl-CoA dehydrogenase
MKQIAVIGGGTMGNGIVHVFAQNGYAVNLIDVKQDMLDKAISTITKNMDRQIAKGTLTEDDKNAALGNIKCYTLLADGVANADLVIEAATENVEIKYFQTTRRTYTCSLRFSKQYFLYFYH